MAKQRYEVAKDFNTKEWFVYDNKTNGRICFFDTEIEAKTYATSLECDLSLDRIARILYNMSLDMDYKDYIEDSEKEISCIAKELQVLKDNNCDSLLQALEVIAMQNTDMEYWKDEMETEE